MILADSSLSGRLKVMLDMSEVGRVRSSQVAFSGVGLTNTRDALIRCVKTVLHDVQVPAELATSTRSKVGFDAILSL